MAADGSLLVLEEVLGEPAAAPSSRASCSIPARSSGSSSGASAVLTEEAARAAALAAASEAASLSARCRSLLPLLKQAAESSSSNQQEKTNSSSKGPPRAELLDLDSDTEGPVVELEVGVGVLDVKGKIPDDARLAELGVAVVDLPADSPTLHKASAISDAEPLDALQRVLAARNHSPHSNGQRPVVSVLSSGSSSEEEADSGPEE